MCERSFSKLTFRSKLANKHTEQLLQLAVSKSAADYTSLVDEKSFFCRWHTDLCVASFYLS